MPKQPPGFTLNPETGYFVAAGVDVAVFDDVYPEGRQSGLSIIMHGSRVATCGDLRFEPTPGQWQPVPKQDGRELNAAANTITVSCSYPDYERHLKGMNPMIYPDFAFSYTVTVKGAGESLIVTVDLDKPVPERFAGKLCFNLELFPGDLFGMPWIMDDRQGLFPPQPNGPVLVKKANIAHTLDYAPEGLYADVHRLAENSEFNPIIADDLVAAPYAVGRRLTIRPDEPLRLLTIESATADLALYDGRMNHNNGWFVVSSEVPAGVAERAIQWTITPNAVADWLYPPIIQVSQVGYHPQQEKVAIIELDRRDPKRRKVMLYRITAGGMELALSNVAEEWGTFLRYNYLKFDFSKIASEGLYKISYGAAESSVFRIAHDVYERGVWQPVLEYFLPVQMCHMRVSEKYRVWHGLCHRDDARMAQTGCVHFDGYWQGETTMTKYQPGDSVEGLNQGGWHDAGDYDLRIESQTGEVYILTLAYETFGVDYDVTTIDQNSQSVEIHQPDGKNDILQQIEHGTLSVVGAYRALGRLYRGIIEHNLRQYVHLGDAAVMTDGVKGNEDDRLVFTEDNPPRELTAAAHLAAAARALAGFNDELAEQALQAAREIYANTDPERIPATPLPSFPPGLTGAERTKVAKIHAAAELFLTTGTAEYKDYLLSERDLIAQTIKWTGWIIARVDKALGDAGFTAALREALAPLAGEVRADSMATPYGIPYRPHIWGAGWLIQRAAYQHYFLYKAYPDLFDAEMILNALNFVLGCHPGANNISFASGVGAKSATTAYGQNRADWSYIPGGVISGTALIRPDFPELKSFPFLWQQTEYVIGGGSSCFMFLVLAAKEIVG